MKKILSFALLLLALPSILQAERVKSARRLNSTTVELTYENGRMLTLDFYGPNIVRLFSDPQGGIVRDPQATPPAQILVADPRRCTGTLTLKDEGGKFCISTADVCLCIEKQSGLLSLKDRRSGKTVIKETEAVAFEKNRATLTLQCSPGEYFYGGGVQNGRFSHRGKSIAIENSNVWVDGGVASPTPFYWSTGGYGVLFHTFKPGRYDFGATDAGKVILSHDESYLDCFLMADGTPAALLADFYQLTGNPVLLPKFGFYEGHLNAYNRDYWTPAEKGFMAYEDGKRYNESQKDNGGIKESLNGEKNNFQFSARAAIDRYLNADMPLGWFLPNDGYGAGYGQTGTLDGNIQNLKEFGDYARSKGVEIGLWTQSDLHPKEGVEALLQRDIVKEVRDAGVRVLKTDVAWVGWGYSFGLNGVADVGRIMPYYGNDARPFIISLDGWAGTQRYAGIWSGDQTGGNWEYIRFHIPTFIGSGLSGQPNITNDMDGIFGGKNIPVNVRDFQWKTFTPMELNMDGWGANPKYPQALGEPATSINRWFLKLKSELMPYAYSIAREAVTGKPMIRAMFLEYPNDYTLGTATQYQFLYGPSLLVAPIYKDTRADAEGNDIRNGIYLPEGRWIDYFSGDVYEGGRIINNFPAPLWKIPVFVKAGAIIPMTLPNNNPSQIRKDYRAYEIYPTEGSHSFREYDDDGTTQAYLGGAATETDIESRLDAKGNLHISVGLTHGAFDGFEPQKETELRVNLTARPRKITATLLTATGKKTSVKLTEAATQTDFENGSDVFYYCAAPELNRFATAGSDFAKVSVTKNPVLYIKLAKADITAQSAEVSIAGAVFAPADPLLRSHGTLQAPQPVLTDDNIASDALTPSWAAVDGADFYEIESDGMLYSTIRENNFTFDGLTPETSYTFRMRAVNADGHSEWTTFEGTTTSDPFEFAVRGIQAAVTCQDQPGSTVKKLFDFDEKSQWHTKWADAGQKGGSAVPFDMIIDLRGVNELDRLEYLPREDGGNGTLIEGTWSLSGDKQNWSEPVAFQWAQDGTLKTLRWTEGETARYIRLSVCKAAGNFGSGREMYVYRKADTKAVLQGDINRDDRLDENDLTSYMNYTGLRRGDSDFDYVSVGDINGNGLIDAYDISVLATELDGGVRFAYGTKPSGDITLTPDRTTFKAGDEIVIQVSGRNLSGVNALSLALPYDQTLYEYAGCELQNMKDMVNLTYDRQHTDGTKALYPTFVNRGNNFLIEGENVNLFQIKLRARKAGKFSLKAQDGMLVDRALGVKTF